MFALFLPLDRALGPDIKQFAIGLAAGIVFDATVIRALLVPSLMQLMGRWNWWLPVAGRRPCCALGRAPSSRAVASRQRARPRTNCRKAHSRCSSTLSASHPFAK